MLDTAYGTEHYESYVGTTSEPVTSGPYQYGYKLPFSQLLSENDSSYLNYNVPTTKIVDGRFTKHCVEKTALDNTVAPFFSNTDLSITRKRFIIPFLSGVMGILIPRD